MSITPNENMENENVMTAEPEEVVEEAIAEPETEAEIIPEEALIFEPIEEPTEKPPIQKPKKFAFTGLLALVVVCAVLWVSYSGLFAPKYPAVYDNSDLSAIYIKDDTVKAHKPNGNVYTLNESPFADAETASYYSTMLENTVLRSPNGEAVYFLENFNAQTYSGDLCVSFKDKEKIKIDADASTGLIISNDGTTAVYTKMLLAEDGSATISLYLYRKGKEPQLIAENCSLNYSPMISYNAKYLAYAQVDPETNNEALYVVKTTSGNLEPEKLADNINVLYSVNDDGYAFYGVLSEDETSTSATDLYVASPKKEAQLVAKNAVAREDCFGQLTKNFSYFARTEENTVQFFTAKIGKEPKMIYEATDYYINPDVENKNYMFIALNGEDTENFTINIVDGNKTRTLAEGIDSSSLNSILASRDYSKVTYAKNYNPETYSGELYYSKTFLGKTEEIKVADNVAIVLGTEDLDYIAYFTDVDIATGIGTLHIFDGKNSKKVAEGVPYYAASFSDKDKKLYYMTNFSDETATADLWMADTKNPDKKTAVDNDVSILNSYGFVYSARNNGSVYYFKNYDSATSKGDLYFAKKGKNPKLVEEGVTKLILEQ